MCRSLDAYIRSPVEKYELVNAPGFAADHALYRRPYGRALGDVGCR